MISDYQKNDLGLCRCSLIRFNCALISLVNNPHIPFTQQTYSLKRNGTGVEVGVEFVQRQNCLQVLNLKYYKITMHQSRWKNVRSYFSIRVLPIETKTQRKESVCETKTVLTQPIKPWLIARIEQSFAILFYLHTIQSVVSFLNVLVRTEPPNIHVKIYASGFKQDVGGFVVTNNNMANCGMNTL